MIEDPYFTKHGNIQISDELINLVETHDWSKSHLWNPKDLYLKGTQCIYYHFLESSGNTYKRNYTEQDLKLRNSTQYILDYIMDMWPNYCFIKGEISHCPPGDQQGMHVDPRVFHRFSHRIHVPITTNNLCNLKVLEYKQHLGQGEIWTFNNIEIHASENLGTTSRVHVIVDIMNREIFNQIVSKHSESYLFKFTNLRHITI
jgi:Aspartyl/Asparaginyl beta-hydroxylase